MIPTHELDSKLLLRLQQGLPLVWEPYQEIAREFGVSESFILERLQQFRADGKVRRIGAVFNVSQLGYRSALCGIASPSTELSRITQILQPHRGITHCYSRSARSDRNVEPLLGDGGILVPNLWFTLSALGHAFERELDKLQAAVGFPIRVAPATRKFKVQVILDPDQAKNSSPRLTQDSEIPSMGTEFVETTLEERRLIALLHQDLPDVGTPFATIAQNVGFTKEDFLSRLNYWKKSGALRRIAVLARHQKLGFTANAMCTWQVPAHQIQSAGQLLSSHREVTHCYERGTFPGFPYNLFAMVHAGSEPALASLVQELCSEIGFQTGIVFHSVEEFKKSSLIPFVNLIEHS